MNAKKHKLQSIIMPKKIDSKSVQDIIFFEDSAFGGGDIVIYDFQNTISIDKSFYPLWFKGKSQMDLNGVLIKSINLKSELKYQLIEDGVESQFNIENNKKKQLLDAAFIQPFIDTTIKVFEVQAEIKCEISAPYLKNPTNRKKIDIAGTLSIVSKSFIGTVAICFPKNTFLKICSKMLNEEQVEITSDTNDAAAELLNMIYGGAKSVLNRLHNYEIQTALPTVINGESIEVSQSTNMTMIIPFLSDAGEFHLEIELANKEELRR